MNVADSLSRIKGAAKGANQALAQTSLIAARGALDVLQGRKPDLAGAE